MAVETIVALFPSRTEADDARQQLIAIGIPAADIAVQAAPTDADATTGTRPGDAASPREWSFLDWLFGAEAPESDIARYRTHVEDDRGAALSVRAGDRDHDRIVDVLERNNLVGIEGTTDTTPRADAAATGATPAADEAVLPTASEELEVGKRRASDTRNYRIRRYVVER
ncbi:MAG TPA: hypothetical protein VF502_08635, partial [Stellaceae bacterium]